MGGRTNMMIRFFFEKVFATTTKISDNTSLQSLMKIHPCLWCLIITGPGKVEPFFIRGCRKLSFHFVFILGYFIHDLSDFEIVCMSFNIILFRV